MTSIEILTSIHRTCYGNYQTAKDKRCGCFTCKNTFDGSDIIESHEEMHGDLSALCPICKQDTVLENILDPELLIELNNYFLTPI